MLTHSAVAERLHSGLLDRRRGWAGSREYAQPFRFVATSRPGEDRRREYLEQLHLVRKATRERDAGDVDQLAHRRKDDLGVSRRHHRRGVGAARTDLERDLVGEP